MVPPMCMQRPLRRDDEHRLPVWRPACRHHPGVDGTRTAGVGGADARRWNALAHWATVCAPQAWNPDEQRSRTRGSRGPGRALSRRVRRIATAAVVVPVLLLPAQRLLRAA